MQDVFKFSKRLELFHVFGLILLGLISILSSSAAFAGRDVEVTIQGKTIKAHFEWSDHVVTTYFDGNETHINHHPHLYDNQGRLVHEGSSKEVLQFIVIRDFYSNMLCKELAKRRILPNHIFQDEKGDIFFQASATLYNENDYVELSLSDPTSGKIFGSAIINKLTGQFSWEPGRVVIAYGPNGVTIGGVTNPWGSSENATGTEPATPSEPVTN